MIVANQISHRAAVSADALAYTGAIAAVVSLLLAVLRLVVQVHVEGGYELLGGLLGEMWRVYFLSFLSLSAFAFVACIAALVVSSIKEE